MREPALVEPGRERIQWRERTDGSTVALVVVAYVVASTALYLPLEALGLGPTSAGGLPFALVANALAKIAAVGVAIALSNKATLASVGLRPPRVRWIALSCGLGLIAWSLSTAIGALYVRATGDTGNPRPEITNALERGSIAQLAVLLFAANLLAPFAEELLYRGVLYTYLRRWGVVVAVVSSSLVFGLFHGVGVLTLTAAALGVLAALAYEFSGSVWPAVSAHAVMNIALSVSSFVQS